MKWKPAPTPGQYLRKNLQKTGHSLGSGRPSPEYSKMHWAKAPAISSRALLGGRIPAGRPNIQSLQTIVGEYIREVHPKLTGSPHRESDTLALDKALLMVFRKNNLHFLARKGYDVQDVVSWAWVLTSKNIQQAVPRLLLLEADRQRPQASDLSAVPVFLSQLLLSEPSVDSQSFRLLLIYSLHLMSDRPFPSLDRLPIESEVDSEFASNGCTWRLDGNACKTMVTRLFRHAGRVMPEALPTIARAYVRFTTPTTSGMVDLNDPLKWEQIRSKTDRFNHFLWFLSLPVKNHPYRTAFIQQQAQFELLRAMAAHKPVLPITRQGYRSVIAVQLAHKKTPDERQSAELKAPSWPPWKEEKLGIDAQRGNEGMYSRAMKMLFQMREAGYSYQSWEKEAAILAGWDTDGSPTVQTRALPKRANTRGRQSDQCQVWAARIKATRSVREAWACFLAYRECDLPPHIDVYGAIAIKLAYRQLTIKRGLDETGQTLPGDGLEVHAEPASARDWIYVASEPPSPEVFFNEMLSLGLRPAGGLLQVLWRIAASFMSGVHYLNSSRLREFQRVALGTIWNQPSDYRRQDEQQRHNADVVGSLHDGTFGSFVMFLCAPFNANIADFESSIKKPNQFPILLEQRLSHEPKAVVGESTGKPFAIFSPVPKGRERTVPSRLLWHAIQLTKLRPARSSLAWTAIFRALCYARLDRSNSKHSPRIHDIAHMISWHEVLGLLRWMKDHNVERPEKVFHYICMAFTRAANAELKHPGSFETASVHIETATRGASAPDQDSFDAMIEAGLQTLKSEFDFLVLPSSTVSDLAERSVFTGDGATDSEVKLPSIQHVPDPATLHAFVRALGAVGDDEGLLHLLRWMDRFAIQLNELAEEHHNGPEMMRKTLVAIRVYLEKPQNKPRVPSDAAQEAFDIISRTPDWEWPSDEEVEDYQDIGS